MLCCLITGCKKNNNLEETKTLLNDLSKINENLELKERKFVCNELNENSIIEVDIFVTENKIYDLNLRQLYNNDSNCMEIGTLIEEKNVKFISKGQIIDNDGRVEERDEDYLITKKKNINMIIHLKMQL